MDKVFDFLRFVGALPLANLLVVLCLAVVAFAAFCVYAVLRLAKERRA